MKNTTETETLWLSAIKFQMKKLNEYNLSLRASDIKPVASAWKLQDHNVIIPRYNILLHFKLLLHTLHIIS